MSVEVMPPDSGLSATPTADAGVQAPQPTSQPSQPSGDLSAVSAGEVNAGQASVDASAQPTGLPPELASHLQENWGLDPGLFSSQTQVVDYAIQAAREAMNQAAQYEQYIQQLQSQRQPQPLPPDPQLARQAPPESKPAGPWNPPEYDPAWLSLVRYNSNTGLYEPASPNVPVDLVQKVNARAQFETRWQEEFRQNPYDFVRKGIKEDLERIRQEAIQETLSIIQQQAASQQVSQLADTTVQRHSPWLYERTPNGQLLRDPSGNPVFTPKGRGYVAAVQQLVQAGVADPALQDQLALKMIGAQNPSATGDRASHFAGTPAARNLAEALHNGNRNGSMAPVVQGTVEAGPNSNSFFALAAETAREMGLNLGTAPSPLV